VQPFVNQEGLCWSASKRNERLALTLELTAHHPSARSAPTATMFVRRDEPPGCADNDCLLLFSACKLSCHMSATSLCYQTRHSSRVRRVLGGIVNETIAILGTASVARNVLDIALALGRCVAFFIEETRVIAPNETLFDIPVFGSIDEAIGQDEDIGLAVAVGDNHLRGLAAQRILALRPQARLETLIHPAASVSRAATIGPGAIVMAGCRIAAGAKIGRLAYLNANTVVAHDCLLGDCVSMSPCASLGGWVSVGDRTMLGMNSAVREKSSLGADVLVGACSFVNTDFNDGLVVAGAPAKRLRDHKRSERYLR
jgi:sugar O-acyltransferase (sialic acid O-acetyltransferase NeuD family)